MKNFLAPFKALYMFCRLLHIPLALLCTTLHKIAETFKALYTFCRLLHIPLALLCATRHKIAEPFL